MTEQEAHSLVEALKTEFDGEAEFEAINGQGRYRFAVTAKRFEAMPQLERQDKVWAVADRVLARDVILDISIILAFAPADLTTIK